MHNRQSRGPQRPSINQDVKEQLEVISEQLNLMEWKIDHLYRASRSIINMETKQMADFSRLNEKVTKISDLAAAVKAAYDGVVVERDAAKAELETLKAADAIDQAAIDTAEASLAAAEAVIAALTAVADGTPVELPPDTGASTGGASTGGATPDPVF